MQSLTSIIKALKYFIFQAFFVALRFSFAFNPYNKSPNTAFDQFRDFSKQIAGDADDDHINRFIINPMTLGISMTFNP